MSENVVIYGAGGLGREVLQVVRAMRAHGRQIDCAAFLVDAPFVAPEQVNGIPVHRDFHVLAEDETVRFVIAIGDPAARARIARAVEAAIGPRFTTVVHPAALIDDSIQVGAGTIIMGLSSFTTECRLGRHVLINPGCTVAHDNTIEDFATLSPGVNLAGRVRLGEGCMLGVGANVAPDVNIGPWSVIGAGACVIRDIEPNTVAVGVPARAISNHE